jgi:hypothetical protein
MLLGFQLRQKYDVAASSGGSRNPDSIPSQIFYSATQAGLQKGAAVQVHIDLQ